MYLGLNTSKTKDIIINLVFSLCSVHVAHNSIRYKAWLNEHERAHEYEHGEQYNCWTPAC